MAEPDYSLAARPFTPAPNPLDLAKSLEQYRILQNQNKITGLEARQKEVDVNALKNYGDTRDSIALAGASPELRATTVSADRGEQENKKDVMSRDAVYIQGERDPEVKRYLWGKKIEEYERKGWVPKHIADRIRHNPNDEILTNVIKGNMGVSDYRTTTGQAQEASSAAAAPYNPVPVDPMKPLIVPSQRPGGALENGSPVGTMFGAPGAPRGTGPQPPRSMNMTDTNATVLPNAAPTPQPNAAPVGSPAAQPGKNVTAVDKTPTSASTNPYYDEVPEVKVGQDMPTGKGVINQGMDPLRAAARAEGTKEFNEKIAPMASAASKAEASLGTIRSMIEGGKVNTDKLGEIKNSIGGFLYAVTKDADFVKKATGLDMSNQEVLNKETTRMGMAYARETNGVRQATQSLVMEIAANPSMLTTEAGNLKVVKIMEAGAKYDKEMAKAAQAYMEKNNGHLTGFENWWTQNHPAANFISKAVPYQIPSTGLDGMQKGVTYEFQMKNSTTGEPIMKDGKPVVKKGVFNGTGFDPV